MPKTGLSAELLVTRPGAAFSTVLRAGLAVCLASLLVAAGLPDARVAAGEVVDDGWTGEVQSVYVHVPPKAPGSRYRVLVALHGMGGNGQDFSQDLVPMADSNGWLIVAPTIGYGDWTDPQQVANEEPRLIAWLDAYLDGLPVLSGLSIAPRVLLLGHSRGAQLALRFAEFHPQRVRGVAALAAGTYTLPLRVDAADRPVMFPFGVADLAARDGGHAFDGVGFAAVPIWIGVGGEDANPADLPRAWDPYLGTTRVQRARTFAMALEQVGTPVALTVFPGVAHALTSEMRQVACAHLGADESIDAGVAEVS